MVFKKIIKFLLYILKTKLLQTCVRQCDNSLSGCCSDDQYVWMNVSYCGIS